MTQKLMKHLYLLCITLLIPLSLTAQTPDTPQPDEIADSLLLARTNTDSISTADTTSAAWSHLVQDRLAQLISNPIFERTQLGLCVYDLTADSVLFSHGERQLLRPASCEKVLTAIAALSQLGGSHRFETRAPPPPAAHWKATSTSLAALTPASDTTTCTPCVRRCAN